MNTFEDRLLTELKAVVAEHARQARGGQAPGEQAPGDRARPVASLAALRSQPHGRRWRPRGLATAGIAASVALAGAVTAAVLVPGAARPAASSQYSLVADFLNQAANAARAQRVPQPGPGQLYFTASSETGLAFKTRNGHKLNVPSCVTSWYYPGGQPAIRIAIIGGAKASDKPCQGVPLTPPRKLLGPTAPHWYPSPASLSHDPGTLLTQLDAAASRGAAYWNLADAVGPQPTQDQIAFSLVERLLQAPISNDLRAALYQATIGIHGVRLEPHTVDAIGRPGTGVSMTLPDNDGSVFASEFILARNTFAFLGTRIVVGGLPPAQSALVRTAIVNANRT